MNQYFTGKLGDVIDAVYFASKLAYFKEWRQGRNLQYYYYHYLRTDETHAFLLILF